MTFEEKHVTCGCVAQYKYETRACQLERRKEYIREILKCSPPLRPISDTELKKIYESWLELYEDNERLANEQCLHPEALVGDEGGTPICKYWEEQEYRAAQGLNDEHKVVK